MRGVAALAFGARRGSLAAQEGLAALREGKDGKRALAMASGEVGNVGGEGRT